jgi:hypothetical protein
VHNYGFHVFKAHSVKGLFCCMPGIEHHDLICKIDHVLVMEGYFLAKLISKRVNSAPSCFPGGMHLYLDAVAGDPVGFRQQKILTS